MVLNRRTPLYPGPKFRRIDDIKQPNVNKTLATSETYFPQGIGSFVALTRLQHTNGADNLKQWPVGPRANTKRSRYTPSSPDAAHICCLNPIDNRPYMCRISAQPFGSRLAPANWGSAVTPLQFSARMLLPLAVGAYVGDVFCAESSFRAKSGFWATGRLPALLGSNSSDRKGRHIR